MKSISLAVGGTGGHIYPAAALAAHINESRAGEARVYIIGVAGGTEEDVALKQGIGFRAVRAARMPEKKLSAKGALLPFGIAGAVADAAGALRETGSGAVAGFGGYVSFPTVLAARLLGIPVFLHEQNALIGKSNRMLSGMAKAVFTSFEETEGARGGSLIYTGNPCRFEGAPKISAADARKQLGLGAEKTTLLVFGGSQGAASLNRAAVKFAAANAGRGDLQILHIAGPKNHAALEKEYAAHAGGAGPKVVLLSYCDSMDAAYAAADLAVCRAGATTMTEVMCLGVASVLVPYPYAAEGHQDKNANYLAGRGAAEMLKDSQLDEGFSPLVEKLLADKAGLETMRKKAGALYRGGAAEKMAGQILASAKEMRSGALRTVA